MNHTKGFSLIETLVALPILLVAVSGVMYIAYQNIFYIGDAKDNVTAFYLAQEGIEFVRAERDTNFLKNRNWINGGNLDRCVGQNCRIDVMEDTINSCSGPCPVMRLSNGYYQYITGPDSPFTRTIRITETVSGREATIDVTVSWMSKLIPRSITLREYIFNWD